MDKCFYPAILIPIKLSLTDWCLYSPVSSILATGQLIFTAVNDLQSWMIFLYVKRRKKPKKPRKKSKKPKTPKHYGEHIQGGSTLCKFVRSTTFLPS